MSLDDASGPKRKRDHYGGGPSNKRAIMSAMRSMTSVNLPPGLSEASPITNGYPRKNNKSNNRREWMKECLKLLEHMMTLDDSKPFREPVDCLKYPDFYTVVSDPIDLSKVMLKFRGGQYSDPFEFQKDVIQLFQDHKKFFKDPKSEVYVRTWNCSLWFDMEFQKILEKYGDKLKRRADMSTLTLTSEGSMGSSPSPAQNTNIMVSINNGSCTIVQSPERQVQAAVSGDPILSGSNWGQLRAIPGKTYPPVIQQQQIISQSGGQRPTSPYYHSSGQQQQQQQAGHHHHHHHLKDYYGTGYSAETHTPSSDSSGRWHLDTSPKPMVTHSPKKLDPKNPELGVARILNSGSQSFELDPSHSRSPEYHFERQHLSERSFSHHSDPGFLRKEHSRDLGSPPHLPSPHVILGGLMSGVSHYSDDNTSGIATPPCSLSSSHGAASIPPTKGGNKAAIHANAHVGTALVGMKLDVGSMWFGTVSVKPAEPIIVHENGVKIHLVHKDKGHKIVLKLKVDEIVRCVAHLGRNRKHTLFMFVTPSFTQTVELALSERDTRASLLVFFMPALTVSQIGRLLHVFHSMNKHSMLGNLFSEIDQKAALALLASIKPNAVDKVGEKIKGLNGAVKNGGVDHHHKMKLLGVPPHNNNSLERNPMARSSSLPVTSSPPPSKKPSLFNKRACSMDQGALDLTVVPTFGMTTATPTPTPERCSPARDSPPVQVVQKTAYKPKFHFRSHSTHATMMKQNSTNSEPGMMPFKGSQSLDLDMMSRGGGGGGVDSEPDGKSPPNYTDHGSSNTVLMAAAALQTSRRVLLARQNNLEKSPLPPAPSVDSEKQHNGWLTGDSDSDLEYEPDDEGLGSSQHSVLLINDSSGEDMTMVDPEDDDDRLSALHGTEHQEEDLVLTEQKVSPRCPITQQYMRYPLKNKHCSHCYERDGVVQLIKDRASKARCPVAGCSNEQPLKMIDMTFDNELCKLVKKLMNAVVK